MSEGGSGYIIPGHLHPNMTAWTCAITGDPPHEFDRVEDLLVHQATEHDRVECAVCGALVPDGYFALRHMFGEHSGEAYRTAYGLSAGELHQREAIKSRVESEADLQEALTRIKRNEG